ncbi:hypothetical protein ACWEQO_05020 [Streptomyces sp. NPDC004051]
MSQLAPAPPVPRSALGARYLERLARSGTDPRALVEPAAADELVTVAYAGRFAPAPVFLSAAERAGLAADLRQVHALLTGLPDRLFDGDTGALARTVGMSPTQTDVVTRAARGPQRLEPLARSDLYRSAEGFKLLELNITSPLGGFENAGINRAMLTRPELASFVAEHGLGYVDTFRGIAATFFTECAAHLPDGRRPLVALCDWPESFRTYEPRLKVMAALFDELDVDALPCHIGQLTERNGRLELHGRPVDVVYRFFLVEEIAGPRERELAAPVLRAVEEGRVGIFSRLDAELYGNKGALALLSDDRYRPSFSAGERACIDRFLPWTRPVRATATDEDGSPVDLPRLARDRQDDLVLKPTLLHGGTGVVPGWTVTPAEWEARLRDALDGPYVLQRRVRPEPEVFPADDGPGTQELFLNWGVFLTGPGVGDGDGYNGCLVRGSTDPEVGVVSMSGGARVACAFHGTRGEDA